MRQPRVDFVNKTENIGLAAIIWSYEKIDFSECVKSLRYAKASVSPRANEPIMLFDLFIRSLKIKGNGNKKEKRREQASLTFRARRRAGDTVFEGQPICQSKNSKLEFHIGPTSPPQHADAGA